MKINIWSAPVQALFNPGFYRRACKASLQYGIGYLFFLSLLCGIVGLSGYQFWGKAQMNGFFDWVERDLPPIAYNASTGLVMNAASPVVMKHERYGRVAILDMTKNEPSKQDFADIDTLFFVTQTRIFINTGGGQPKIYELLRPERSTGKTVVINEIVKKVRKFIMPVVGVIVFIFCFTVYFFYKLILSLIFSLFGLVINLFRKQKLSYAAVLNVTIFATTALSVIDFLTALPGTRELRLGFGPIWTVVVTTAYLLVGIKFTDVLDQREAAKQPPPRKR